MTEKIVLGWCDGTLRDGGNSEKTNGVLSKSSDLEPNFATVDGVPGKAAEYREKDARFLVKPTKPRAER